MVQMAGIIFSCLVNQCEAETQAVRNGSRTLRASGIWTDDNGVLVVWYVLLNVPLQEGLAVQIVDRDVEETLVSCG